MRFLEDNNAKLNKIDWVIMLVITFLYALLSFYRLGDLNIPTTYETFNKNSVEVIELEDKINITKMRYYVKDKLGKILVSTSIDGLKYDELIVLETTRSFTWQDLDINREFKYIKFEGLADDSILGDIGLYSNNSKVNIITKNNLTDETDLVPREISFLNSTYFDEIFYARSAYEYVNGLDANEWTHPPLGKLLISVPILLFGFSPFTFRLMNNLAGILMLPLMYIFGKKLFKTRKYALLASLLMMFDNFHFAHTRIALIDSFQILFILLSVLFMKDYFDLENDIEFKHKVKYLLLSGFFIGLAIATKWNALYIYMGLTILFLIYTSKEKNSIIKLFSIWIIAFILIPLIIYILSFLLFPNLTYYDGTLFGIISINKRMFSFHSNTIGIPFSSKWFEWPIMGKPNLYFTGSTNEGLRMIISNIGNPLIWWFGIISFVYLIIDFIKKRKDLFLIILILSSYLPYILIKRPMFMYHYFITLPFIMLGIVAFIKWITEKIKNNKFYYFYIIAIIIMFFIFYPVVSGLPVKQTYIEALRWLKNWRF